MINTIIFDLSEVYLQGLLGVERNLSKILNISEEEILLGLNISELMNLFKGEISEDIYLENVIEKNGWEVSKEKLKKNIRKNFKEIEGTRRIIEMLKNKGFKLGLCSVHVKEWIEYCEEKFEFQKLFNHIYYSFQKGICKPNKLAYEIILYELNSIPEECIFIDDSVTNIFSAREMGINSILFKNSKQLKKDLQNYISF